MPGPKISILLPCHNEGKVIAGVIEEFRMAMAGTAIYVIDNGCTDDTVAEALAAGAVVINEPKLGKGNAIRRAFMEIDADIYVMADGDGTYEAAALPAMLAKFQAEKLDMLVGVRVEEKTERESSTAYRRGHRIGNALFNKLFLAFFGPAYTDIFSGYRIFSRRYVKSLPITSKGFDIETELAVHAIFLNLPTAEMDTNYKERKSGSTSKLSTYKDGAIILMKMLKLYQAVYPLKFYGIISLLLFVAGLLVGAVPVVEFWETGLVNRFPSAFLAASLEVSAFIFFVAAIIMNGISTLKRENRLLFYILESHVQ